MKKLFFLITLLIVSSSDSISAQNGGGKPGSLITVGNNFVIPQGVHVIFDAPNILFEKGFVCPIGSSFETRNEGCEL